MAWKPRDLTDEERKQLLKKLDDLNEMLSEPEDEPHLLAAVQHVMREYGQVK